MRLGIFIRSASRVRIHVRIARALKVVDLSLMAAQRVREPLARSVGGMREMRKCMGMCYCVLYHVLFVNICIRTHKQTGQTPSVNRRAYQHTQTHKTKTKVLMNNPRNILHTDYTAIGRIYASIRDDGRLLVMGYH